MRLPQPILEARLFQFSTFQELEHALRGSVPEEEIASARVLFEAGLPPITSRFCLAALIGINPGLIWSFVKRPHRHYRTFSIKKGAKTREITAPRVALKIIQKWLSVQLEPLIVVPDHVFGFVRGKSHIDAANVHANARWIYSVDLANFFPSTPSSTVKAALRELGFPEQGAELITDLTCLRGNLAQGSPLSPCFSNICFREVDGQLQKLACSYGIRLTRYADDIVFSGQQEFPPSLGSDVAALIAGTPWDINQKKIEFSQLPNRLKVHGLLVHGDGARLTKGYRNKIRAFQHLKAAGKLSPETMAKVVGHLNYAAQVEARSANLRTSDSATQRTAGPEAPGSDS